MKAIAAVMLVSACASAPPPGPRDTAAAYAESVRRGDYDHAYEMMSAEYRRKTSRDEFVRFLKDNDADVRAAAERLRLPPRDVELRAHVDYGPGDRLPLVYEAGQWRLAEDPLDGGDAGSDHDALHSLRQHRGDGRLPAAAAGERTVSGGVDRLASVREEGRPDRSAA